jgi:hypothetical protein
LSAPFSHPDSSDEDTYPLCEAEPPFSRKELKDPVRPRITDTMTMMAITTAIAIRLPFERVREELSLCLPVSSLS